MYVAQSAGDELLHVLDRHLCRYFACLNCKESKGRLEDGQYQCQATSRKCRNWERSCLYLTELVVRVRNLQANGSLLRLGLVQRTAQTAIVKADLIL